MKLTPILVLLVMASLSTGCGKPSASHYDIQTDGGVTIRLTAPSGVSGQDMANLRAVLDARIRNYDVTGAVRISDKSSATLEATLESFDASLADIVSLLTTNIALQLRDIHPDSISLTRAFVSNAPSELVATTQGKPGDILITPARPQTNVAVWFTSLTPQEVPSGYKFLLEPIMLPGKTAFRPWFVKDPDVPCETVQKAELQEPGIGLPNVKVTLGDQSRARLRAMTDAVRPGGTRNPSSQPGRLAITLDDTVISVPPITTTFDAGQLEITTMPTFHSSEQVRLLAAVVGSGPLSTRLSAESPQIILPTCRNEPGTIRGRWISSATYPTTGNTHETKLFFSPNGRFLFVNSNSWSDGRSSVLVTAGGYDTQGTNSVSFVIPALEKTPVLYALVKTNTIEKLTINRGGMEETFTRNEQ